MPLTETEAQAAALRDRLPELMLRDAARLQRRLDGLRRGRDPGRRQADLRRIAAEVDTAVDRVRRRAELRPAIRYPEHLPVSARRDDIAAALRDHQVVIVAGETGSGKTTQLPKMLLESGRGVRGLIGHTQPRRLAARAVADRLAEELDTPLGTAVGYKVRFTDRVGDDTLVKVMTDGILLAEIQGDRLLHQYDTVIVDEAHERSLNVDFILGYLKQLLPRRPDLTVVVTSATIDPERFSQHFDGAPIVEVSGRTYPVEVRYRPLVEDASSGSDDDSDDEDAGGDRAPRPAARRTEPRDPVQAICEAVDELCREPPGDILVFLSGEREIRDTADALRQQHPPDTEILPLYARLSAAEQHRVFAPHTGRRIVLATNVAETSLTVPGIRYVVDPGTARISRYSRRLKVQRLPIEAVSQASADQRKGRCGRVADGICIRLYSEADYESRPRFTDPEILRTNLAAVILQMTALGLGDIAAFPFVDPPDRRNIRDGTQLLEELGALDPAATDPRRRLTEIGRKLAQLPIDPRLGRMVLAAERNGVAHEVLVIAAALSIQDPRERPVDAQAAADERHRRFVDERSDFLGYWNLWTYLQEQQRASSSSAFRRLCRAEYLHYLRVREWQDLHGQLRQIAKGLGIHVPATREADAPHEVDADLVHQSLLAGLLSHVGMRDVEKPQEYLGARGARFAVWPGSALFRRNARWVMAAELVETSRLWGRVIARIEPEWAESLAPHLVKRSYSEPHWEKRRGEVVASERVTLYGLPLVVSRKVSYGRIDPQLSRELFIRHALVEGDWQTRHGFYTRNQRLLEEVAALEDRARRRDILADDERLLAFYDERIGAEVVSARHFDTWWREAGRKDPHLLDFTLPMLVAEGGSAVSPDAYPDQWRQGDLALDLGYRFEPGSQDDGVTMTVPLAVLNRLRAADLGWHVPGLREELVTELIRGLPKNVRRSFVPAPDYARQLVRRLAPDGRSLPEALSHELWRMTGVEVPVECWATDRLPPHLRLHLRVVDAGGAVLAEGDDIHALRRRLVARMVDALTEATRGMERRGERSWTFGDLPRVVTAAVSGQRVTGYPAVVDEGATVGVRVLPSEAAQRQAMRAGVRRLLLLVAASPVKQVLRQLANQDKLVLSRYRHGTAAELFDDCAAAAVDHLVERAGGPPWTEAAFRELAGVVRAELPGATLRVVRVVTDVLGAAWQVEAALATVTAPGLAESRQDVERQLARLVRRGFVVDTGWRRLPDLVRYLRAAERRLERLPREPDRDRVRMAEIRELEREHAEALAAQRPGSAAAERLADARWLLEELRVSYFAQMLGTPQPVSVQRVRRAFADALAQPGA